MKFYLLSQILCTVIDNFDVSLLTKAIHIDKVAILHISEDVAEAFFDIKRVENEEYYALAVICEYEESYNSVKYEISIKYADEGQSFINESIVSSQRRRIFLDLFCGEKIECELAISSMTLGGTIKIDCNSNYKLKIQTEVLQKDHSILILYDNEKSDQEDEVNVPNYENTVDCFFISECQKTKSEIEICNAIINSLLANHPCALQYGWINGIITNGYVEDTNSLDFNLFILTVMLGRNFSIKDLDELDPLFLVQYGPNNIKMHRKIALRRKVEEEFQADQISAYLKIRKFLDQELINLINFILGPSKINLKLKDRIRSLCIKCMLSCFKQIETYSILIYAEAYHLLMEAFNDIYKSSVFLVLVNFAQGKMSDEALFKTCLKIRNSKMQRFDNFLSNAVLKVVNQATMNEESTLQQICQEIENFLLKRNEINLNLLLIYSDTNKVNLNNTNKVKSNNTNKVNLNNTNKVNLNNTNKVNLNNSNIDTTFSIVKKYLENFAEIPIKEAHRKIEEIQQKLEVLCNKKFSSLESTLEAIKAEEEKMNALKQEIFLRHLKKANLNFIFEWVFYTLEIENFMKEIAANPIADVANFLLEKRPMEINLELFEYCLVSIYQITLTNFYTEALNNFEHFFRYSISSKRHFFFEALEKITKENAFLASCKDLTE